MKKTTISMFISLCMAIAGVFEPTWVFGDTLPAPEDRSMTPVPADSTEKNVRDRDDNATLTPSDQAQGSKQDVDKTRRIRKALMSDKTLSTNAQNIKIVTLKGRTTLRGPVKNLAEQESILKKARKVVGTKNVENQLEVTGP
jgi:hyperosmotically inducible periplasmic protein